eukprot:GFYU01008985.1.p1 GENE.GFYU01008985.1~~GFYU01008985.1.p1  ORF type:complete len:178 (-),score=40.17 GFYU01008985.1:63-596(-)
MGNICRTKGARKGETYKSDDWQEGAHQQPNDNTHTSEQTKQIMSRPAPGRQMSVASLNAVQSLDDIHQRLSVIQGQVSEALTSIEKTVIAAKIDLNRTVEGHKNVVGVDEIQTGELNSGKTEARAMKKELSHHANNLAGVLEILTGLNDLVKGEKPGKLNFEGKQVMECLVQGEPMN